MSSVSLVYQPVLNEKRVSRHCDLMYNSLGRVLRVGGYLSNDVATDEDLTRAFVNIQRTVAEELDHLANINNLFSCTCARQLARWTIAQFLAEFLHVVERQRVARKPIRRMQSWISRLLFRVDKKPSYAALALYTEGFNTVPPGQYVIASSQMRICEHKETFLISKNLVGRDVHEIFDPLYKHDSKTFFTNAAEYDYFFDYECAFMFAIWLHSRIPTDVEFERGHQSRSFDDGDYYSGVSCRIDWARNPKNGDHIVRGGKNHVCWRLTEEHQSPRSSDETTLHDPSGLSFEGSAAKTYWSLDTTVVDDGCLMPYGRLRVVRDFVAGPTLDNRPNDTFRTG